MAVRLYVDDSGAKGQPSPAVFAGLLQTDEQWASLSEAWRAALDRDPRVWRHKMEEAAGLHDAYGDMSGDERDRKLRALATVLKLHSPTVFVAMVDVDRLAALVKPFVMAPVGDPYFQLSLAIVWRAARQLAEARQTQAFRVVFDENRIESPRVRDFWPVILDNIGRIAEQRPGTIWPAARRLVPEEAEFATDDGVLPLQAADTYAWVVRMDALGRGQEFRWLRELLPPIVGSANMDAAYFNGLLGTPMPDDVRRTVDPQRYADLLGLEGPMEAMPSWKKRRAKAWRRTKGGVRP